MGSRHLNMTAATGEIMCEQVLGPSSGPSRVLSNKRKEKPSHSAKVGEKSRSKLDKERIVTFRSVACFNIKKNKCGSLFIHGSI